MEVTKARPEAEVYRSPAKNACTDICFADDDLRVQTWCVAHLDRLTLDAPSEIKSGIVALVRMLFAEAHARDAASGRLWCSLSLRELSRKLGVTKKTLESWWDASEARHLAIDAPDQEHAQRLRRRPRWDVIAPLAQAAALAGQIPGPPLFAEVAGTAGTVPPQTGVVTTPVCLELGYSLPQSSDFLSSNFENFGGGVRGDSPLQGGIPPLTPTAHPGKTEEKR